MIRIKFYLANKNCTVKATVQEQRRKQQLQRMAKKKSK